MFFLFIFKIIFNVISILRKWSQTFTTHCISTCIDGLWDGHKFACQYMHTHLNIGSIFVWVRDVYVHIYEVITVAIHRFWTFG